MNFSPSTKKTSEYSFELFLSIHRYWMFFLKFITSVLSNNRFGKQAIKATMVMRFPTKKNASCLKASRNFPEIKDGILHPQLGCIGTPLPIPQSLYGGTGGRTYADITTKISRIDRLPNLLKDGALLAGFARRLHYYHKHFHKSRDFSYNQGKFSCVNDMSIMIDVSIATNYSGVCFDYFLSFFSFFRFFPLFVRRR